MFMSDSKYSYIGYIALLIAYKRDHFSTYFQKELLIVNNSQHFNSIVSLS